MMRKLMSVLLFIPFCLWGQASIYTNDMDYVLGDVKQAFIQDKISTPTQVLNLIAGFKAMQVNGIRVPIITENEVPNKQALDYFCQMAVEEGFLIFANPAQSSGGHRIACGIMNGELCDVKDDEEATQKLIDRIIDFDKNYDCKWINPFNEDGKSGAAFSVAQMNTIYSTLAASDLNAELIGPCPWGIPAAIQVFNTTDVENYVTVAATHNLGFNHSSWPEFIALAKAKNLPVWDSEVTHSKKEGVELTRLEAALANKVDGLVLYNSWGAIDLTDGSVKSGGQTLMDLYLKPSALKEMEDEASLFDVYSGKSSFSIKLMEPSIKNEITVVDINGRIIRQLSSDGKEDVLVDNVKPGVYVLILKAIEQLQREKVQVY